MKVINKTRTTTLMQTGQVANNFRTRFLGLMGRKALPSGAGLIIIPNNSVHCFFMRFTIDVVFVSKNHQVVYIYHDMKPWRISKIVREAHYVVELNGGVAAQTNTQVGDYLEWRDEQSDALIDPIKPKKAG